MELNALLRTRRELKATGLNGLVTKFSYISHWLLKLIILNDHTLLMDTVRQILIIETLPATVVTNSAQIHFQVSFFLGRGGCGAAVENTPRNPVVAGSFPARRWPLSSSLSQ